MKSTGIVRRIDDLGRVVIPKEVRRAVGVHEGDPLEIYTDGNCVCFKKYQADIDELITTYHLLNRVLYKKGVVTALDYDGSKICGHPSLSQNENAVFCIDCGSRYTRRITLGHNHLELTAEEDAMLRMTALTIRQKAMEIWDEYSSLFSWLCLDVTRLNHPKLNSQKVLTKRKKYDII